MQNITSQTQHCKRKNCGYKNSYFPTRSPSFAQFNYAQDAATQQDFDAPHESTGPERRQPPGHGTPFAVADT
jgi:hypothetical protein